MNNENSILIEKVRIESREEIRISWDLILHQIRGIHPIQSVRFVTFTSTICRPFYVSTTTSVPRDVVVALDISNTMIGNKLNEARRAVLTVLETLRIKDNWVYTFEKSLIFSKTIFLNHKKVYFGVNLR